MATFQANLAALESRSPRTAEAVLAVAADGAVRWVPASSGEPVVELGTRALDSRRDPVAAAERAAAGVARDRVVVAGFGSGYFVEALRRRGIDVAAIVETGPAILAAAMQARDLRPVLRAVPVVLIEHLKDRVELACLRARADCIVPHGPSVAASPDLALLVERWDQMPVASRPPRVLIAGPIYGGSLEIARSVARAATASGAEARLFDFSVFADGYHAFSGLEIPHRQREVLHDQYASLLGQALVTVAGEWRPDLVLALAQAPLGENALAGLKDLGVTTAFWFVENGRVLTYWRRIAPHYDWCYAIQDDGFLETLAHAGTRHAAYLPMACDPERHVPVRLTAQEQAHYGADVSFAGAPYLNRRRLLPTLTDFRLRIWGEGWKDEALSGFIANEGRRFTLDEMVRVFAGSRINLNLHSAAHVEGFDPQPDYLNPRTFELAACEAFQLVDSRTPLRAVFADDEVATFGSVADLRERVRYYLAHDDERRAMASRARRRALAEHTYAHRVQRIFRDTLRADLVAAALVGVTRETMPDALARLEAASPVLTEDEACLRVLCEVEYNWGLR
jgi:spore maturation protein CgeB